jgi:hypothetical protein
MAKDKTDDPVDVVEPKAPEPDAPEPAAPVLPDPEHELNPDVYHAPTDG